MATTINDLRNRCRTCRFFATNEMNVSSGYCWQCDKPVRFTSYSTWPNMLDPSCADVIADGNDEPAWEPLTILAPYFEETTND